MKLLRN